MGKNKIIRLYGNTAQEIVALIRMSHALNEGPRKRR